MIEEIDIRQEVISTIDNLNDMYNDYPLYCAKQGLYDTKRDFWYHYVENNTIDSKTAYRIIKELKRIAIHRRIVKNNMEILRVVQLHEDKLKSSKGREELSRILLSTMTKQDNPQYTNDSYNQEELNKILGNEVVNNDKS